MDDLSAQRTLVKSPPELWAEISDIESLSRRLGEFGDVRITRLDPETTVAWEGERIRGTVNLEPSGWGTKVTLAAELLAVEAACAATPEPIAEAEVEVEADVEAEAPEADVEAAAAPEAKVEAKVVAPAELAAEKRGGFFSRLFRRRKGAPAVAEAPESKVPAVARVPEPAPEPVLPDPDPVPPAPAPEPDPGPVIPEPAPGPIAPPEPDPEPDAPEPIPALAALAAPTAAETSAAAETTAATATADPPLDADGAQAILVSVLDDLGAAHHRPFSRG